MAGIRHLIDTEAHKALFDALRAKFGDDVGAVIQALGEHNSAGNAHGATPYPDPNTIMRRDEAGRVRVADPVHEKDVVNKGYADTIKVHPQLFTYTASGVFTAPSNGYVHAILVGGGQGGGWQLLGLAGQVKSICLAVTKNQQLPVLVGAGGVGGKNPPTPGNPGGNTSFGGMIAFGGGTTMVVYPEGSLGYSITERTPGHAGLDGTVFNLPPVASGHGDRGGSAAGYGAGGGAKWHRDYYSGAGAPGVCIIWFFSTGGELT